MKKNIIILSLVACHLPLFPQVPLESTDIMLQGFAWNSHNATKWTQLTAQSKELSTYFDLVWLPPSAAGEGGGSSNMGYHPYQWSNQNSSWGTRPELKALIDSLHKGGSKVIADIIVNHRAGNSWTSFIGDTYGNNYTAYQFNSTHICKDDEAKDHLTAGQPLSDNYDYNWNISGDKWGGYAGARDLDHSQTYVRDAIKEYLKFLKNEIGYDGWRYDLVKGYDPAYTKEYNEAANAYLSVGEYYQSNYDDLAAWVNATGKTSMVFDFCAKQALYNWAGGNNYATLAWSADGILRPAGLMHHPSMRQYAVTFVDNHDTAPPHTGAWAYSGNVSKAYAFLLSSPGIPCVFWSHWLSNKTDIKRMIIARKAVGLHSNSDVQVTNTNGYYEAKAVGKCGELICRIGTWEGEPAGYSRACSGSGWAYYTKINGSDCETITDQEDKPIGTVTIRFKAPENWTTVKIWAWNAIDLTNYTGGTWPGIPMTPAGDGFHAITLNDVAASTLGVVINNGNTSGDKQQTYDLFTMGDICWEAASTFTTEGDTKKYDANEVICKGNSIDAVNTSKSFVIYPNPATDRLNIFTDDPVLSVAIQSVSGRLMKTATEKQISISGFPQGLYLITVRYVNGTYQTGKLIVQCAE
ncbi:MAG: starch-binding protein [Dysgonamonadaceae bacterium]|jgi:alpha-amylase|nr:starch-binding protein [Dysgonamonadaceae bacterium]